MNRVAVIGAGGMGTWFSCRSRRSGFEVGVFDVSPAASRRASTLCGAKILSSIEEAVGWGDVIILAVPGDRLRSVIEEVSAACSKIMERRLVFDISTFKTSVVSLYDSVPRHIKAASVHPLFGPLAEDNSLLRAAIVPLPGRVEGAEEAARFLAKLGIEAFIVDAETHDRMVAKTIGLSYALGVAMASLASEEDQTLLERLAGTTYRYLMNHYRAIASDPKGLITEILNNPLVRAEVRRLVRELEAVVDDPEAVIAKASRLKPDRGKAYRAIYECLAATKP